MKVMFSHRIGLCRLSRRNHKTEAYKPACDKFVWHARQVSLILPSIFSPTTEALTVTWWRPNVHQRIPFVQYYILELIEWTAVKPSRRKRTVPCDSASSSRCFLKLQVTYSETIKFGFREGIFFLIFLHFLHDSHFWQGLRQIVWSSLTGTM